MKIKLFIFSILFVILCLFLSLNQECFATNDLIFNVPSLNLTWNITQIMDDLGYSYNFNSNTQFLLEHDNNNNYNILYFTNSPLWYDSQNEQCFIASEYGEIYNLGDGFVYDGESNGDFELIYIDDMDSPNFNYYFSNNVVVYTDNTFTTPIDLTQYNNVSFGNYTNNENNNENNNVNNSVNNSVVNNSVVNNSVNDNESENNNGILDFLLDFWENLVHIIVPSQEDLTTLQSEFSSKILSKFSVAGISRTSDYNNNDKYPSVNYNNKAPVFDFGGYEFSLQTIKDYLDMPLSFGRLQYNMGDTISSVNVNTGGLTIGLIINLMFGISVTTLNFVLFNKFFEKE